MIKLFYEFNVDDAFRFASTQGIKAKEKGNEIMFDLCPYCKGGSSARKDKGTFSINKNSGAFNCLRASCGVTGNMVTLSKDFDFSLGNQVDEYYKPKKQYRKLKQFKEPIKPKEPAIAYLESRGISEEVANKYEITTQSNNDNILVFPFFDEKGILQFIKYRKTDFDKAKDKNKEWCESNCKPILFGMKQCVDFTRLVITEGQCFNGDAEIMTPNGWVRLENYAGQQVLQVNEDMSANFVNPKAYIVKRHTGKMVDVEIGGNYFTSTTDDHNLVLINNKGKVVKKMAGEKISSVYHIPTAVEFDSVGLEWSNDEIALFLAISADGTLDFRKNTGYKKSQHDVYARFGLTKERKVDRLIGILKRLGYKFSDSVLLNERGKKYHSICFGVPDKFNTKYLPWEFVTKTTVKQKKFIIEEMVWWDGNHVNNRNQYEYMSIYKHNIDVMQAIASTCGYMSTIMRKSNGGNGKFKKSFIFKLSILLSKKNVSTQQFENHKKVYEVDKTVYCVTVDSGMILVRQNNKISVSGNCDSLSVSTAGIENCVSVPTGAKGFTWLPYCWDWINQFEEVVVFGDYENGTITLLDELSKRLKCVVKHVREDDYKDCKDANELLLKYGTDHVRSCVENAISIPVNHVIELADVEDINIYDIEKLPTGIHELDRLLYGGLPFGGVCLLSGKRGEGKSTLGSQILLSALDNGYCGMAYSGELPNSMFKSWFNLQAAGPRHLFEYQDRYGDTGYAVSKTNKQLIDNWHRGRMFMYDNKVINGDERESLLDIIEGVIMRNGVRVVLLDNLMTGIDLEVAYGSDKYERQSQFVKKLTRLALTHNVLIILIAHKRKNSFSQDENDEVSGSGDISNLATVVISYGKDKEIGEVERMLTCSKNRLFGKTNTKGWVTKFDEKSKRIYGNGDNVNREYGWNTTDDGFMQLSDEEFEQMQI